MAAIKWVKVSRDDYHSACGTFKIVRLEACDNRYTNRDEWILSVATEHGQEAVDVYSLLRDAKATAEEIFERIVNS